MSRLMQDEEVELKLSEMQERESIAGHIRGFLDAAAAAREAFIQSELRRVHAARQTVMAAKLNAVEDIMKKFRSKHEPPRLTPVVTGAP